jgi:hypothetical protein
MFPSARNRDPMNSHTTGSVAIHTAHDAARTRSAMAATVAAAAM